MGINFGILNILVSERKLQNENGSNINDEVVVSWNMFDKAAKRRKIHKGKALHLIKINRLRAMKVRRWTFYETINTAEKNRMFMFLEAKTYSI